MNIYIKLFITVLIASFLFSCGKENLPDEIKDGETSALYNGEQWDMPASGGGSKLRKDTISIGLGGGGSWGHVLGFTNILKKTLRQKLHDASGINIGTQSNVFYYTNSNDIETVCDTYKMLEADSTENWIEITKEANSYGEIWGNFSVTLVRVSTCNGSPFPDTVRLRNGTFHIWNMKYF